MRITKLKFTKVIYNPFRYDFICGKYKIDRQAYNLYYDSKLYCEAYDEDGNLQERFDMLRRVALEHANKLLKQGE
jgi:hypothetical protein